MTMYPTKVCFKQTGVSAVYYLFVWFVLSVLSTIMVAGLYILG